MLQIGGEDTNITFEDQQQINTFARKSARLQELKDEIEGKKVRQRTKSVHHFLLMSQLHPPTLIIFSERTSES